MAGLTEVDHIFAHVWPRKLSLEKIKGFIDSEVTRGRVVMLELNNAKLATKIVGDINLVIIKKKTGSGNGKWKGREGEDIGGEGILERG